MGKGSGLIKGAITTNIVYWSTAQGDKWEYQSGEYSCGDKEEAVVEAHPNCLVQRQ